ncbi:MAG: PIN domain-containing protein, partial [Syntrophomonadaceae bacterium]|nr:PIN domain-containing protein [Syntrophomonadaceae bacterium]
MARVEQFVADISTYNNLMLDTNTIIYFLDGVSDFADLLAPLFEMIELGQIKANVSVISEAELLVKPYRDNIQDALEVIKFFLDEFPNLKVISVSREIADQAAKIRADLGIKLPDAIILATALQNQCDLLLGNDLSLMRIATKYLPTVLLNDYINTE